MALFRERRPLTRPLLLNADAFWCHLRGRICTSYLVLHVALYRRCVCSCPSLPVLSHQFYSADRVRSMQRPGPSTRCLDPTQWSSPVDDIRQGLSATSRRIPHGSVPIRNSGSVETSKDWLLEAFHTAAESRQHPSITACRPPNLASYLTCYSSLPLLPSAAALGCPLAHFPYRFRPFFQLIRFRMMSNWAEVSGGIPQAGRNEHRVIPTMALLAPLPMMCHHIGQLGTCISKDGLLPSV